MADEGLVLDDARQGMQKSLDGLQRELSKIRTGRANPAVLEDVQVDYYGTPTLLKSLATLSAPEPRLLTVQPFDPGALEAMEKAVLKSDLGLTPANDGKILRIPVPELTEQRREEIVKHVKRLGEDRKVTVRTVRRDAVSTIKAMEKEREFSKDDSRRAQKQIQDLTDEFVKRIDDALSDKEEDLLKI